MHRRRPHHSNFSYVSSCVKYLIFILNFIFWLFGGLLIGIGLYAFVDKWQLTGWVKLETVYDVILNISLVMVMMGGVVFIVSFAGCVGALRENTCLLKFYSLCLLIFFLLEMAVAIIGFVFPHTMQAMLEENFTDKIIHTYRDDPDLQNFVDFAQQEFRCCGLSSEGYKDWAKNEYFNCSSPSGECCGVPYSCCMNATSISSGLVNIMCGYGVQTLSVAEASKKVWTSRQPGTQMCVSRNKCSEWMSTCNNWMSTCSNVSQSTMVACYGSRSKEFEKPQSISSSVIYGLLTEPRSSPESMEMMDGDLSDLQDWCEYVLECKCYESSTSRATCPYVCGDEKTCANERMPSVQVEVDGEEMMDVDFTDGQGWCEYLAECKCYEPSTSKTTCLYVCVGQKTCENERMPSVHVESDGENTRMSFVLSPTCVAEFMNEWTQHPCVLSSTCADEFMNEWNPLAPARMTESFVLSPACIVEFMNEWCTLSPACMLEFETDWSPTTVAS